MLKLREVDCTVDGRTDAPRTSIGLTMALDEERNESLRLTYQDSMLNQFKHIHNKQSRTISAFHFTYANGIIFGVPVLARACISDNNEFDDDVVGSGGLELIAALRGSLPGLPEVAHLLSKLIVTRCRPCIKQLFIIQCNNKGIKGGGRSSR